MRGLALWSQVRPFEDAWKASGCTVVYGFLKVNTTSQKFSVATVKKFSIIPPPGFGLRPAEAEAAETNMAPEVKLRAFEGDDHFVLGSEHALAGLQKVFTSSKGDSAEG